MATSLAARTVLAFAAGLLLLSLVACGSASPSVVSSAPASTDATAAMSGSATAIAESLASAGLPCADLSSRPVGTNVADEARCSIGEDDVIIRTFATTEHRNLYMEASGAFVGQISFDVEAPPRVVGPTWIVTTDTRATAEKIRVILGGELR